MGIEPTCSAWKADILPLNYTRISDRHYYNKCLSNCQEFFEKKSIYLYINFFISC